MPRLPQPGSDDGTWGDILNDYLSAAHAGDGSLKPNSVTSTSLAPGAVSATELSDDTVTEPKLHPDVRTKLNAVGGGGGSTNLTTSTSGSTVTINSDTGSDAVIPAATTSTAGVLSASDKTKLDGVASGATANATDAALRDRATHTGTQAISTVTNLQTTLDGKAASSHSHAVDDISNASTLGKSLLTASNAATVRAAIAAAPSSGISMDATTDASDRLAMTPAERTKLAGLSGTVYVTTTNAALPPGLADGTVIARYAATAPATPVVSTVGTATSIVTGTTIAVTTSATIPVGDVIMVAMTRGAASGTQTMGSATVSLSSGAVDVWARASACRSGTHDVALLTAKVTTSIPAGSTVTVTTSTNNTSRAALIVAGIHLVSSGAPDASSGDDANGVAGNVSAGATTSGTSLAVLTDSSTTTAHTLVLGAFGIGGSATFSPGTGETQISQVMTAAGSGERGVLASYKVVSTTAVQTMNITASASSGLTGVAVALPVAMVDM